MDDERIVGWADVPAAWFEVRGDGSISNTEPITIKVKKRCNSDVDIRVLIGSSLFAVSPPIRLEKGWSACFLPGRLGHAGWSLR